MTSTTNKPLVAIVMGSQSDLEVMQHAMTPLDEFKVSYEVKIISAHRAPDHLIEYAGQLAGRGFEAVIAAAGLAAHLPGLVAAKTVLPVLGVPMEAGALKGLDALLSIVQMPGGVPVGTLAIGKAGATNAALLATAILGNKHPEYRKAYESFRNRQTEKVLANRDVKR